MTARPRAGHCRVEPAPLNHARSPHGSVALLALLLASCVPLGGVPSAVEQKRAAVQRQLGPDYRVQTEGIFVVATRLPEGKLFRFKHYTLRPAAHAMWHSYFDRRPDYPITIYLFTDDPSYRRFSRRVLGLTNVGTYGYYAPRWEALAVNLTTGEGTLIHELTHALMKPDFPGCPVWFDEGLATLHEEARIERGVLVGRLNWRLADLEQALAAGRVIPLPQLLSTSWKAFTSLHYAEARHLVLYLQRQGLLERFYRQFRRNHRHDPTGARTLVAVTGRRLPQLEQEWLAWVRQLRSEPGAPPPPKGPPPGRWKWAN